LVRRGLVFLTLGLVLVALAPPPLLLRYNVTLRRHLNVLQAALSFNLARLQQRHLLLQCATLYVERLTPRMALIQRFPQFGLHSHFTLQQAMHIRIILQCFITLSKGATEGSWYVTIRPR
jgi:hypothetical protein